MAAHVLQRGVEIIDLIERFDLLLVAKKNIGMIGDQHLECVAMPIDAERVRQGNRYLMSGVVSGVRRLDKRGLRTRRVKEIALHVDDLGGLDRLLANIGGREMRRRAEIGAHGALRIGRDQNETGPGCRAFARRRSHKLNPDRLHVVTKHRAELVVSDLPDEGALSAQRSKSRHGIPTRAARDLLRWWHVLMDRRGPLVVDQGHCALVQRVRLKERILDRCQHIHQCVPDPHQMVLGHIDPHSEFHFCRPIGRPAKV